MNNTCWKNRYSIKIGSKSGEKISQVRFKPISHDSGITILWACGGQREVSSSSWITAAHHWLGLLMLSGSIWRKYALQMCSCFPVCFPLYNPSLFKFGCIRGFPNWIQAWHVTLGPVSILCSACCPSSPRGHSLHCLCWCRHTGVIDLTARVTWGGQTFISREPEE